MFKPYIKYNNIKYFVKASNYENKLNIKSYDVVSQLKVGGATIYSVATCKFKGVQNLKIFQ